MILQRNEVYKSKRDQSVVFEMLRNRIELCFCLNLAD